MIETLLVLAGGLAAGATGGWFARSYRARGERETAVRDAVRTEEERRREAMRIYGRETWERAEHEGELPSRVTNIDVT